RRRRARLEPGRLLADGANHRGGPLRGARRGRRRTLHPPEPRLIPVRLWSLVVATLAALALACAAKAGSNVVSVNVDRTAISTALGHKFVFRSTIANHGTTPVRGLIAHLNVLSL